MSNYRIALAAAGLIGLGAAQSMAAVSGVDQDFAQKAAAGGLAEVSLGQLAQQNASSPQVKDFAQRMVTDHGQANQELQQIAGRQNLTLPSEPASGDKAAQERFSSLKGAAFDSAYAKDMVRDHQADLAEFQKEAKSGQNPELKAFAQKQVPVLRQHLQMAQAMAAGK